MKRVISLDDLASADLKSSHLYEEYVVLLEKDIVRYFSDSSKMMDAPCPGCAKVNADGVTYKKMGLCFKICSTCNSHYVCPRPTPETLRKFYETSNATSFWRKEVVKRDESHMQYIHSPRINWIRDIVDEYAPSPSLCIDYQSKYPSFLKKLAEDQIFQSISLMDPYLFEQIELLPKSISVSNGHYQCKGNADVMIAFEVVERMSDPNEFFTIADQCTCSGGLLLITTATCSGFEYQVLRESSPNVNPINRMNLLSLEALTQKINDAGFDILELSTPGRLDMEIVRKKVLELPNLKIDPFWRYVFEKRDEKTWHSFQEFLQLNRLSSHVRIAARKRGNGS